MDKLRQVEGQRNEREEKCSGIAKPNPTEIESKEILQQRRELSGLESTLGTARRDNASHNASEKTHCESRPCPFTSHSLKASPAPKASRTLTERPILTNCPEASPQKPHLERFRLVRREAHHMGYSLFCSRFKYVHYEDTTFGRDVT